METRGEIRDVARKVACCEAALEGCGSYLGITDRVMLLEQLKTLQRKEEQLREAHLVLLRAYLAPQIFPPVAPAPSLPGPPVTKASFLAPPSAAEPCSSLTPASAGFLQRLALPVAETSALVRADAAASASCLSNAKSISLHEALGITRSNSPSGESCSAPPAPPQLQPQEEQQQQQQQQSLSWIGRHALYNKVDRAKKEASKTAAPACPPASPVDGTGLGASRSLSVTTAAEQTSGAIDEAGAEVQRVVGAESAADRGAESGVVELLDGIATAESSARTPPEFFSVDNGDPTPPDENLTTRISSGAESADSLREVFAVQTSRAPKGEDNDETRVQAPYSKESASMAGTERVGDLDGRGNQTDIFDSDVGSAADTRGSWRNEAGLQVHGPTLSPKSSVGANSDASDATVSGDESPPDNASASSVYVVAATTTVATPAVLADSANLGAGATAVAEDVQMSATTTVAEKLGTANANRKIFAVTSSRPTRKRRKSAQAGWRSRYNADEFESGEGIAESLDEVTTKLEEVEGREPQREEQGDEDRDEPDGEWMDAVDVGGAEDREMDQDEGQAKPRRSGRGGSSNGSNGGSKVSDGKQLIPKKRDPPNAWKRRCADGDCQLAASFGRLGKQAIYCSAHKDTGMVNVTHRRCDEPGCVHQPSFNIEGEKKALFCQAHKKEGMVNVCSPRCASPSCVVRPSFGFLGEKKASFCDAHKMEGMTNIRKSRRPKSPNVQTPQPNGSVTSAQAAYLADHHDGSKRRLSYVANLGAPEQSLSTANIGPVVSGFGDSELATDNPGGVGIQNNAGVLRAGGSSFLDTVALVTGGSIG